VRGLVAFNLWRWIEENRTEFEPPVGNKVIWEDSQFTAMVVRGPNARRDFHVDPSDEIFYMLRGAMRLEYMEDGRRHERIIREGELCLLPALVPHSPHRPADTWGLVIEVKRRPEQTESLLWFCERCDRLLHQVTMHVADIERELKTAIGHFDGSLALRTCGGCGHVHAESAPPVAPVTPEARSRD
jgi:3-hydroxyanthranilate 3,4-dioxygenase